MIDLAPDAASAKAGQGQAKLSKWPSTGRSELALWGECQGSGKNPYQVHIDLREPAFKCNCPSRKFPCKHALGLLLMFAENPEQIATIDPPEWVAEWLASREQRAAKREAQAQEKKPVDAEAQAKRAAKREAKVAAGVEELSTLMIDLIRQGLAAAQTQPGDYWRQAAARMVDAQAPGLARLVRELGEAVASGDGWQHRFLRILGQLHAATQAYRRIDQLPPDLADELRAVIGWTTSQDELLQQQPPVAGAWIVAGQRIEDEEQLRVQRTWLIEPQSARPALVLSFAAGNQPLDTSLVLGTQFQGELAYYPGSCPLRAIVKQRTGGPASVAAMSGVDICQSLETYADALATNPWLEHWPMPLGSVVPVPESAGQRWWLRDANGDRLPVAPRFDDGWRLLSISGGRPITVFAEWDGQCATPMSALADGVFYAMSRSDSAVLARVS